MPLTARAAPSAWRRDGRRVAHLTAAMKSFHILAVVIMMASVRPVSAAAAAASSSAALGMRKEKVWFHSVHVGDEKSVPLSITANTRRPGFVKLEGHPRGSVHKMFHRLTLEVFDDGGFVANDCQLQRVRPVTRSNNNASNAMAGSDGSAGKGGPTEELTMSKIKQRKALGYGNRAANAPAVVSTFGPFDVDRVTWRCEKWKGGAAEPVSYRVRLVSSRGPDNALIARLLIGASLVALAPVVSGWTFAYYGVGMALSVLAVALLIVYRVSRAMPGNRTVKAFATAPLFAALAIDPSHLSRVIQAYVSICLKPMQLVVRAMIEQNPEEAGLPLALVATFVMLSGAGVGLWAVRRFMIDAATGKVEPSVSKFSCVAMRIIGVLLLQFSTLDRLLGAVLVGCGLAVTIFEPLTLKMKRKSTRSSNKSILKKRGSNMYGASPGVGEGESDEDMAVVSPEEDGMTPVGNDRGGRARYHNLSDSGIRRRVAFSPHSPETKDQLDSPRRAGNGTKILPLPFKIFGLGRWGSRRGEDFPATMDPEPNTPPLDLLRPDGVQSPGTPVRRSWGLGGLGRIFGKAREGGAARDEDDSNGGREAAGAAAASGRSGGKTKPSPGAGQGRASPFSPTTFAPSPLGGRQSGRTAALRRRSGVTGTPSRLAAQASPGSPVPPVGMAAAAKGRFLSSTEYDAMGSEATDAGLEALYGTPEFAKWMKSQSHRIRLVREDYDGN